MQESTKRGKDKAAKRAKEKARYQAKLEEERRAQEQAKERAKYTRGAGGWRDRRREKKAAAYEADPEGFLKRRKRNRIVAGVAAGVVVVVIALVAWLFYIGALAPYWAAARYNGMSYITEQEIEDYITSYRVQQGCTDDESWAEFLADSDLTPEDMRERVIKQLVTTNMIEVAAEEAGVELTDEEWEEYATNIKNNLAFGDDEIYEETIAQWGQTVEEFETSYRQLLLRERLFEAVVEMPEATEEQALSYIASYYTEATETKHIYYFTVEGLDDDDSGSLEKIQYVQTVLDEFIEMGVSVENFEYIVEAYADDDDLISRLGANGWDLDIDDYSTAYQEAVDYTDVGEVSDVFEDEEGYAFVYIDMSYTIPGSDEDYELSDLPETLQEYFLDCAAYVLWQNDCDDYLVSLYNDCGCIIYAMPDDVSYNVDMSAYVDDEDDADAEDSDDDSDDDEDSTDEDDADDSSDEE